MKSKGKKKGYIGIAITAILLIVTVVADLLVSRYITMIKLYFRDDSNSVYEMSADEALSQAADLTEELGNEGIVLLKNKDNASLPLAAGTKINLFGIASYQTLYQGSGSASSWFKQDLNTNMKKGLEDAGFEVNPGLWQFYEDNYKERSDQEGGMTDMSGADHSILEQSLDEYEAYDYEGENVLTYSENYSDVAMVVIGRAGGEGSDATMEMDGYVGGDAGKHYLELQSVEQELLSYVEEHYDKVIVVLNTAMVMETGFLDDEAIDAALWIGMPGSRIHPDILLILMHMTLQQLLLITILAITHILTLMETTNMFTIRKVFMLDIAIMRQQQLMVILIMTQLFSSHLVMVCLTQTSTGKLRKQS